MKFDKFEFWNRAARVALILFSSYSLGVVVYHFTGSVPESASWLVAYCLVRVGPELGDLSVKHRRIMTMSTFFFPVAIGIMEAAVNRPGQVLLAADWVSLIPPGLGYATPEYVIALLHNRSALAGIRLPLARGSPPLALPFKVSRAGRVVVEVLPGAISGGRQLAYVQVWIENASGMVQQLGADSKNRLMRFESGELGLGDYEVKVKNIGNFDIDLKVEVYAA